MEEKFDQLLTELEGARKARPSVHLEKAIWKIQMAKKEYLIYRSEEK